MKPPQLLISFAFILLATSCINSKRFASIQTAKSDVSNDSLPDADLQQTLISEVYHAFSRESENKIILKNLPEATDFSDTILELAKAQRVRYLMVLSDHRVNERAYFVNNTAIETNCDISFRLKIFDVRKKKVILDKYFNNTGIGRKSTNWVYPMSERQYYYPVYTYPKKHYDYREDISAMEMALRSVSQDLRYSFHKLLGRAWIIGR